MDQTFVYPHALGLDEIRLLWVSPGASDSDAPLQCELSTCPLADVKGCYTALSYCWGDSKDTKTIRCNDQHLTITSSLFAALQQYRDSDSQRLWVDAVCINQGDNLEKTHQVRKMTEIYESAQRVLIWIGTKDRADMPGLDLLHALSNAPSVIECESGLENSQGQFNLDLRAEKLPALQQPAWPSMFNIFQRPWFGRKWIIQEALVNPVSIVRCGDFDIAFDKVMIAGQCLMFQNVQQLLKDLDVQPRRLAPIMQLNVLFCLSRDTQRECPLDLLLSYSLSFDATEPRDSIFALIGLATMVGNEVIDYQKDLTSVLVSTTRAMLYAYLGEDDDVDGSPHCARIISLAPHTQREGTSSSAELPSWVPDYTSKVAPSMSITDWYLGYRHLSGKLGRGYWEVVEAKVSHLPMPTLWKKFVNSTLNSTGTYQQHIAHTDQVSQTLRTKARHFDTVRVYPRPPAGATQPFASLANRDSQGYKSVSNLPNSDEDVRYYDEAAAFVKRHASTAVYGDADPMLILWRTMVCEHRRIGVPLTQKDFRSFQAYLRSLRSWRSMTDPGRSLGRVDFFLALGMAAATALVVLLRRWFLGYWGGSWTMAWAGMFVVCMTSYWTLPAIVSQRAGRHLVWTLREAVTGDWNRAGIFMQSSRAILQHRRLFASEQGRIGLAPFDAEPGDQIMFVLGHRIPLMLRPIHLGDDGDKYRLVGDCYLDRVMNGEAHDDLEAFQEIAII